MTCEQAHEKRLLIATFTLSAPFEEMDKLVDIREEYDEALHDRSDSKPGATMWHATGTHSLVTSSINSCHIYFRRAILLGKDTGNMDVMGMFAATESGQHVGHTDAMASAKDSAQSSQHRTDTTEEESSGGAVPSLRRKSVKFADAPLTQPPADPSAQKEARKAGQQGLKKGFLVQPKPALKKTSSLSEQAATPARGHLAAKDQWEFREGGTDGRDAAFSGRVLERDPLAVSGVQHGMVGQGAAFSMANEQQGGAGRCDTSSGDAAQQGQPPGKKVSRFKQQRSGL
jgi:hypothetical protein